MTKLVENGADPNARTGPPHKTALQVAASAGTLADGGAGEEGCGLESQG